jgi:hypothetical protein
MTKTSATDSTPGSDRSDSDSGKTPLHIVELGKARPRKIRALKNGEGPLVDEVAAVLADIEERMGAADRLGTTLLPVVVVVERRRKKAAGRGMLPMLGM